MLVLLILCIGISFPDQDKLSKNPRLGIVNSQLRKMDENQKKEINKTANDYLDNIDHL